MTVVSAFTEEQAERLTGVSVRQLQQWSKTAFFIPSLSRESRRPYGRIYSFRDLVCLKVLNGLRNESKVSLQHLRQVKTGLAHLGDDAWAKTTLYVLNRRVVFDNPETGGKEEIVSGQGVLQIPLKVVHTNMEQAVKDLRKRDRTTIGKITRKRGVVGSRPVIAGTRIPVSIIKEFHKAGYSIKDICKQYPALTENDVRAAIKHGSAA